MGARLGTGRGPCRRAPELDESRFNSPAAAPSWGHPFKLTDPPFSGRTRPMEELPYGPRLSSLEDHLDAPRGRGRPGDSPYSGSAGGAPCRDLVRVAVRVEGDTVLDARL